MMVRIWSDEHRAYWRPNGCGYTIEVEAAGLYDAEDALERTACCGPEKRICIWAEGIGTLKRTDFKHWYENDHLRTRRVLRPAPPRPELDALLERARQHVMTPEEFFEQRVSFVHGNVSMSNPSVTREMVREVALAELPDKRLLLLKDPCPHCGASYDANATCQRNGMTMADCRAHVSGKQVQSTTKPFECYDGVNVKQDPDGSWMVRSCYLDHWIIVPTEGLAKAINEAFDTVRATSEYKFD